MPVCATTKRNLFRNLYPVILHLVQNFGSSEQVHVFAKYAIFANLSDLIDTVSMCQIYILTFSPPIWDGDIHPLKTGGDGDF